MIKPRKFPRGWDEERVKCFLDHYKTRLRMKRSPKMRLLGKIRPIPSLKFRMN
jgi:hypothetical protein